MKIHAKLAVIAGITALCALPTAALGAAGGHLDKPTTHKAGTKAKAYGKFCQGESKKHVAGQRGTPFSACVSGAKKLLRQQAGG